MANKPNPSKRRQMDAMMMNSDQGNRQSPKQAQAGRRKPPGAQMSGKDKKKSYPTYNTSKGNRPAPTQASARKGK